MKEYNAQISQNDDDDEYTSTYQRVKTHEFLMELTRDDSRFLLPPDKDGVKMFAITIQDILKIYKEFEDKNA